MNFIVMLLLFSFKLNNLPAYLIGHFRNERATGAEMRSAIVSGIVTRNAPISYWLILSPVPSKQSRKSFFFKCAKKSL